MLRKYLTLFIGLAICVKTYSQQDPHYTMYMYNMNVVNPAYAGSTKDLSIGLLGREQWVGIKGAPTTYTANIHSSIGKRVGLGLSFIKDEIGPTSENNMYLDVSYTVPLSRTAKLSFGVKGGVSVFSFDTSSVGENQRNLRQGASELFPNIGAGIFYHTNKFYAGLSVPNVLRAKHLNKKNPEEASEVEHYFITSGYVFDVSEDLKVKPSTLLKLVPGAPASIDLSLNFLFHDRLELGASHRLEDSWAGTINILATKKLRLGYAYDFTVSELSQFSRGSHEFMLLYQIPLVERRVRSPRFF